MKRERKNRLCDSMYCLWKHGERLRYYDIESHDYTELLQTLHLETFENIEKGDDWKPKYDYLLFKKSIDVKYEAERISE